MEPKNIIIVGTVYPYRGGLAHYNERLAKELIKKGHNVTIYTFSLQYPKLLFPGKTQINSEVPKNDLKIHREINSINPFNWIKVGRRIKREKPNIVIIKYWIPFMAPCFGSIIKQIKKNNFTIIISIVDNIIPHEKRFWDSLLTNFFVSKVDGFLAMSQTVLNQIRLFDKQKPKLLAKHPIYDIFGDIKDKKAAVQNLGLSTSDRYILFFGLIRDYKGLDLLIEAFSDKRFRKTNIKLIIAGEYYSNKQVYQALINKWKLRDSIIEIDKYIPDSEVANYFNAADLVVQPYKSATQSGVAQVAYHFNKPTIVTDVGGLKEIVDNKLLVVRPNHSEIAQAILNFFNIQDRSSLITDIIEKKKEFSWERLVEKIFTLANQVKNSF